MVYTINSMYILHAALLSLTGIVAFPVDPVHSHTTWLSAQDTKLAQLKTTSQHWLTPRELKQAEIHCYNSSKQKSHYDLLQLIQNSAVQDSNEQKSIMTWHSRSKQKFAVKFQASRNPK